MRKREIAEIRIDMGEKTGGKERKGREGGRKGWRDNRTSFDLSHLFVLVHNTDTKLVFPPRPDPLHVA